MLILDTLLGQPSHTTEQLNQCLVPPEMLAIQEAHLHLCTPVKSIKLLQTELHMSIRNKVALIVNFNCEFGQLFSTASLLSSTSQIRN